MSNPNKMGVMPVPKLLLSMAAPMMLSMLVQALYNVVDSMFVSHIGGTAGMLNMGDLAVTALTLAFPVQMLIMALCVGTGVGVNAALARSLGKKDREKASCVAGNAVFLSLCYFALVLLFGLFLAEPFIAMQTTDATVRSMAAAYLQVVTVYSFGSIGYMCFEKLLQATGRTTAAMIGQLIGAVTNIVLDPILIFGYMGLPAMGVKGAAIATVLGQCVSLVTVFCLHMKRNTDLDKQARFLRPDSGILRTIFSVGAPAILMQALTSILTFGMNLILGGVSVAAVTAYGIYYKLQNFIFMPVFGLNNASIPILSYNLGARNQERIRIGVRWGLLTAAIIMAVGFMLFQLLARPILGLFVLSEEVAALCVTALKIISCGFLLAGCNIILQGVCQALENGIYSLMISFLRLIVVVLPLAWLFSSMPNAETLVWVAFPIAEAVACAAAAMLTGRLYRLRVLSIKDKEEKTYGHA